MSKIKSNPYVYPAVPFNDLSNKDFKNNFLKSQIRTYSEIKKLIGSLNDPQPKIRGIDKAEKILSIFLDNNFRFGPKEYILDNAEYWLDKINYFIDKKQAIRFSILGFPFKTQVPLKTERNYPDMGDVLSLHRLQLINDHIKRIYPKGAETYVFTEGVFAPFVNIPLMNAQKYADQLKAFVKEFGYINLKLIDLGEMEKEKNFDELYSKQLKEYKRLYKNRDKKFMNKYNGAYDSIYKIITTNSYPTDVLMDVYNSELKDKDLSAEAKEIRNYINEKIKASIIKYFVYLGVRDELDYLQKRVPNYLPLSVSPKPNRLGIIQVNSQSIRLPHHGMTVYNKKKDYYEIEYLVDIQRSNKKYIPIYLKGDPDNKPFFYIKEK